MRHADFGSTSCTWMAVVANSDLLDIVVRFLADHTPVAKAICRWSRTSASVVPYANR